jgi:uncharacterized protein
MENEEKKGKTVPTLTEDEVDDLLYFARTGDKTEFNVLKDELRKREGVSEVQLFEAVRDGMSGNGVLHMAAANGHSGKKFPRHYPHVINYFVGPESANISPDLLRELCKSFYAPTGPQNPAMLSILNSQNKAGNTALHWAALNGHLAAVKVLLEEGADPTITNSRGHDAVFEAEINDKSEVVEWVLKEGGDSLESGVAGGVEGEGEGEAEEVGDEEGMEDGDETEHRMDENEAGNGEASKKLEKKLKEMDI